MNFLFSPESLRRHSCGAVSCVETAAGVEFNRFTEVQRCAYPSNGDLRQKTFACSGIELRFATDAEHLVMPWHAARGSSRKFALFDCFIDGILVKHDGIENYEETPDGTLELDLPGHLCSVRIVFPNLAKITVKSLELSGGNSVEEVPKRPKMIAFGDSITQGYDARFPSQSYISLLADSLGLELVNKAVGGDRFRPDLLNEPDPFVPELITVAYGTNDWNGAPADELKANARLFMEKLTSLYPQTHVVMLLPVWRADCDRITRAGSFEEVRQFLRECGSMFPDVEVIQPELPHVTDIFSDGRLHPNDWGFSQMFRSIEKQLKLKEGTEVRF